MVTAETPNRADELGHGDPLLLLEPLEDPAPSLLDEKARGPAVAGARVLLPSASHAVHLRGNSMLVAVRTSVAGAEPRHVPSPAP